MHQASSLRYFNCESSGYPSGFVSSSRCSSISSIMAVCGGGVSSSGSTDLLSTSSSVSGTSSELLLLSSTTRPAVAPFDGYGLRVPPGPCFTGLMPLYNLCGVPGYLDLGTGYWYCVSNKGKYICTPLESTEPSTCDVGPDGGYHNHAASSVDVFLELRYYLVLRAFAAGYRCRLSVDELNTFAEFAHEHVYQGIIPFTPFPSVPEFIDGCSYTGHVFLCDRSLYPPSEQSEGLMYYPIPLCLSLFEFISYVECIHFGLIERLAPHLLFHKIPLWCPSVKGTPFPNRRVAYTAQFASGKLSSFS